METCAYGDVSLPAFFWLFLYHITLAICCLQKGFRAMPVCLATAYNKPFRWTWNWTLKMWVRNVDANNTDPVDHGCFEALPSVPWWLFCVGVSVLYSLQWMISLLISPASLVVPACRLRTSCPACRQRARTSRLRSAGNDMTEKGYGVAALQIRS